MIGEFLFWLGAGDEEVVAECPGERTRVNALGGTVLVTSLLALIAGTAATREWLHVPLPLALPAGMFWGLAIMNLDRWLLLTIRRQETPWRTLVLALPRIGLALVVGLVISTPTLLGVFHSEVTAKATEDRQAEQAGAKRALDAQFAQIKKLAGEREELQQSLGSSAASTVLAESPDYAGLERRLSEEQRRADAAKKRAICELDGTCGTKRAGAGTSYRAKEQEASALAAEASATKGELDDLGRRLLREAGSSQRQTKGFATEQLAQVNGELSELRSGYKQEREKLEEAYAEKIGPLDRIDALASLASEHPSMRYIALLLALFILAIDCLPVTFKTLSLLGRPSRYEVIQEERDERQLTRRALEEDARDELRRIEIASRLEEAQVHAKLNGEAIADRLRRIADLEREVSDELVPELRARMMELVPELAERYLERQKMFWRSSGGSNANGGPGHPGDSSMQ
jgi:Domain of unknown function (DUF4407)